MNEEDLDEVRLIENPSRRSSSSRRHRRFYVATDIEFSDEQPITQPKQLFQFCTDNKVIHWSKGSSNHPDDIRRYIGTIHVWERW